MQRLRTHSQVWPWVDAALAAVEARNAEPLQADNHDFGAVNFLKTLVHMRAVRRAARACPAGAR